MIKSLRKFGGAILLYAVVFFGIVAIVSRINTMNEGGVDKKEVPVAYNYSFPL